MRLSFFKESNFKLLFVLGFIVIFMIACNNSNQTNDTTEKDSNNNSEGAKNNTDADYDENNPFVLKYNEQNAKGNPKAILAEDFSELVAEKTNGRVQIDTYLGGSAADYGIDSVIAGIVDFNQMVPSNVSDLAKSISVLDAPYLFEDMEHFMRVVDPKSEVMEIFNNDLTKEGIRAIMVSPSGERHVTTTNKEIKTIEDIKGLKIRVVPSDVYSDTMSSLGAPPSAMPFSEVATSLTTGTIDGQENPFSQIVPNGLHEIQKYIILTGHIFSSGAVFMNNEQFEKLTEEDQELLLEAGKEAVEKNLELIRAQEEEWYKEAEEESIIIGTEEGLDLEGFKEAAKKVHEKYKDDWAEAYEKILDLK